jgi:hypothetical protein
VEALKETGADAASAPHTRVLLKYRFPLSVTCPEF